MIRALYTGASGMLGQQFALDTIANNLANINTTGFKKSRTDFNDLLYQTYQTRASEVSGSSGTSDIQVGNGVRVIANERINSQGRVMETNNPLDIMIEGDGFFRLMMPDGSLAYTRDGSFKIDGDGQFVTSEGYYLADDISIPYGAHDLTISSQGEVSVLIDDDANPQYIGDIYLSNFINPNGLKAVGGNVYTESSASGPPQVNIPGEYNTGLVRQGFLESSNVDVAEQMIKMIITQRAYEVNTKVINTANKMLELANNLRGV